MRVSTRVVALGIALVSVVALDAVAYKDIGPGKVPLTTGGTEIYAGRSQQKTTLTVLEKDGAAPFLIAGEDAPEGPSGKPKPRPRPRLLSTPLRPSEEPVVALEKSRTGAVSKSWEYACMLYSRFTVEWNSGPRHELAALNVAWPVAGTRAVKCQAVACYDWKRSTSVKNLPAPIRNPKNPKRGRAVQVVFGGLAPALATVQA